ncbi:HNH endonuclease signature motif containing protein [Streptomyces sp. SID13031]|uniref:HNH endonuclease signature motif containing protein n=1 Tax=Streptomyces sp. SID13031 TaxID=2706046 RepID=UPI0013CCFBE9|nr:HNH endonuclease signature motif containing protein [Streptomyces sp. SID13031]NEA31775.1 hypothetical protein [Streptomyces sp. SID13031]
MFEDGVTGLDAAETLAATARAQAEENEAGVQRLLLGVHYADLHPDPAMISGDQSCPGGERGLYYGGPGCPGVAEFAVAEFGVVLGVSTESAAKNIGQALALRHRLPLVWDRVVNREATPWKARQVATACVELSVDAAAIVDQRVASIVDTVGPVQLRNIIKAALWEADPEAAREAAEQKARERGVWTGRSDDHGTTTVFVKAATGDVIHFDATLTQIADALTTLDGPAPRQLQRAKAFGILADPSQAHQLLRVMQHLATTQPTTTPGHEPTDTPTDTPAASSPAGHQPPNDTPASDVPANRHASTTPPAPAERPATPPTPDQVLDDDLLDWLRATAPTPTDEPLTTDLPTDPDWAPERDATDPTTPDETETENAAPVDETTQHHRPAGNPLTANRPDTNANAGADHDWPHRDFPAEPPFTGAGEAAADLHTGTYTGMDAAARSDLTAKLSAIKAAADRSDRVNGIRPAQTKLYVHLTDETLLAGGGTMRVEGFGPVYGKLAELVGHDRIIIQPVIDLHDQLNTNAYEIPRRLREHIKLAYPVEQFPYGPAETTDSTDLDHVIPYNPSGPPGQTSTTNLRPLRRRSHRIKTHAGWKVHALNSNALEWTTPPRLQIPRRPHRNPPSTCDLAT